MSHSIRRLLGSLSLLFQSPGRPTAPTDLKTRYLEISKLPTTQFQASLPRLPIPKLEDSIDRYLQVQRCVLSDEEYQETEKIALEFASAGSRGWWLQQQLIDKDRRHPETSYNREFWHDRYMKDRRAQVPLLNPFVILKRDPKGPSQAERAANLIHSVVRFRNSLEAGYLQPDVVYTSSSRLSPQWLEFLVQLIPHKYSSQLALTAGVYPLDMFQYRNLFGTTRVPKKERDELVHHLASQHIVVMRNGHIYSVQVQQENGLPVDKASLCSTLSAIINDPTPPPSHQVSYLTTADRDTWADAHQELMSGPQNALALQKVESALLVVCLDDKVPETEQDGMCAFLHNYGANRWFDKSFMILVSADAEVAIQPNHSCGDGWIFVNFSNKLFFNSMHQPSLFQSNECCAPLFQRVSFNLSENLKTAVQKAKLAVESKCGSLSLKPFMYRRYGQNFMKSKGLKPHSMMQIAYLMAYYRLHGRLDSTVNPCSTTAFLHGRTEWVHPVTMAVKECAEAFALTSDASVAERAMLLKKAIDQSDQLSMEAKMGAGFDRHLHALKCMAEQESISLDFYQDPAYNKMNNIQLFIVTLAGKSLLRGVHGPVSSDGLTTGYFFKDDYDYIDIYVSTYNKTRMDEYIKCLLTVLDDIYDTMSLL